MSELKAYGIRVIDGLVVESESGQLYLKSEADKVIAEKDAEIQRLKDIRKVHVEAIESMGAGLLQDNDEIRHQKYKRCLAMAEMCEARYDEEDAKVNGCGASWEYISKEMKYWERWRNRWLKIAELFKDAK